MKEQKESPCNAPKGRFTLVQAQGNDYIATITTVLFDGFAPYLLMHKIPFCKMKVTWNARFLTRPSRSNLSLELTPYQSNTLSFRRRVLSSSCHGLEEDPELDGDEDEEQSSSKKVKKRTSSLKGRRLTVLHRLRQSKSHLGKKHSAETREKIRQGILRAHARRKQKTEPNQTPNPLAVTIPKFKKTSVDYLVMEKAILEMTWLRRDVNLWLEKWYSKHKRKPTLEDMAQDSPEVHNKFSRFIALQEFIRANN